MSIGHFYIKQEFKMIKGVVFDLDHTLFDRYATFRATLPELYKALKNEIPENVLLEDFVEGVIESEKKYIYHSFDLIADNIFKKGIFSRKMSGKEFWGYVCKHCWIKAAVKYPFTEPMLIKLREMGLKIGIITNGRTETQQVKIDLLGIGKFVDETIICDSLGVQKPETLPFEVMCEKLNLKPNELLYVGDNPINDVMASRNAGYVPVWVKTLGTWDFNDIERCEYEVNTVEEIPELVDKINKGTV